MISRFFIDRPVFATVLSLVIVLAGLLAMRVLPISQYPQIVPPEVVVTATYPGANAQTIAETVAALAAGTPPPPEAAALAPGRFDAGAGAEAGMHR